MQAKKEIESGKSFAEVAKSKSIDPTSKANGGELNGRGQGPGGEGPRRSRIFSAKKGVLGGPVKTPFGYYVYEVNGDHRGQQPDACAVAGSIKQQLTAQQQQQALSKFVKEFRKKWEGKTECASGYTVQDCKGYKKPKTSTEGAATPQIRHAGADDIYAATATPAK